MICPNCNFVTENDVAYCPQCGAPMAAASNDPTNQPQVQPQDTAQMPQQQYSPNAGYGTYTAQVTYNQQMPQQQAYQGPLYCKNCGRPLNPGAAVCVNCGVAVGVGNQFCANCGNQVDPMAAIWTHCGAAQQGGNYGGVSQAKSKLTAGLLGIFLGLFGVHNFYLGFIGKAVIQLVVSILGIFLACVMIGGLMIFGMWIWGLVEGIMILTGSIPADAKGIPLRD